MGAEIGEALRAAREAHGLDLEQAQEATKIRRRYLAALEEELWDALPGRAYASGFLRTYAAYLGLDPAPLTERLHDALGPPPAEEMPEPVVKPGTLPSGLRRRARRPLLYALAALAAAGIVAWAIASGNDETAPPPRPAEEAEQPAAEEPPAGEAVEAEEPRPEPERVRLRLAATGDVWVCLVDGAGRALVDGETLGGGEERGPFSARRFELTLGNDQVELVANGEEQEVEPSPSPLGFALTPAGLEELPPAQRPTCG